MTSRHNFTIEEFCQLVFKYPAIYNYKHPNYRHKKSKERCWNAIARELRTTAEAVEKRWKSLRTSYSKHIRAELNPNVASPVKGHSNWCKWTNEMERFRNYLHFNERHQPNHDTFEVPVDPNSVAHLMSDDTRDDLTNYVEEQVTYFLNQRGTQIPPECSVTIRAPETVSTPKSKPRSTVTITKAQNGDARVASNINLVTPVASHGSTSSAPFSPHGTTSSAPVVLHGTTSLTPVASHGTTSSVPFSPHATTSSTPVASHGTTSYTPVAHNGTISSTPVAYHGTTSSTPVASHGTTSSTPVASHGTTSSAQVAPYASTTLTPVAPFGTSTPFSPVAPSLVEATTHSATEEQPPNIRAYVKEEVGAPLDATDHFMLKCSKRLKKLPPEVQADLQMQIAEVIASNEQQSLLKINTWRKK